MVDSGQVVIVTGGRRTGTTLLNAVLCAEPDANELGPEAQLLTRFVEAYSWGLEHFDWFGSCFFESRARYQEVYASFARNLVSEASEVAGRPYLLVLKNPELAPVLSGVADLLPSAKVLVLVRDPRDQICSELDVGQRQLRAGRKNPMVEARDIASLARHFMAYYRGVPQSEGNTLVVRYESLVSDWGATSSEIGGFLKRDLCFDPSARWRRVGRHAGLQAGPSSSPNYGEPVSRSSIGRYRSELSAEEASLVTEQCRSFMRAFGYS